MDSSMLTATRYPNSLSSASACSSQNRMSISRYIVVAVVKCSCACSRLPGSLFQQRDSFAHAPGPHVTESQARQEICRVGAKAKILAELEATFVSFERLVQIALGKQDLTEADTTHDPII